MTVRGASLIDHERSACLCDVGQADYVAAVAIAVDGEEHLILARRNAIGDTEATYEAACLDATHEQLGPMPNWWKERVHRAPTRCGRPTKAGRPCRIEVSQLGATCGWHRTQTTERIER